jgi:hypothetical protein
MKCFFDKSKKLYDSLVVQRRRRRRRRREMVKIRMKRPL